MTNPMPFAKVNNPPGQRRWVIAEGCIPDSSHGPAPEMTTHETACVLTAPDAADSSRDLDLLCGPRAGRPLRDYSVSRAQPPHPFQRAQPALDSRQAEKALMTTIAPTG
jgi:hypothetical protein